MPRSRRAPQYIIVGNHLRNLVLRHSLKLGDPLPTELDLCRKFRCSRVTVRQAMSILVQEGKILRRQGSGTYVADVNGQPSSRLIAAIAPNLVNSEITRLLQAFYVGASRRGYSVLPGVTGDIPEVERRFLETFAKLQVEGILKFPTVLEFEDEMRHRIHKAGIPCVVINDFWTESRTDSGVSYDEEMSVEIVVAHMLKLGHRSLAMVEHDHAPRHRAIHRFLAVLKREGLPHEDGRILLHKASDHVPLEILYGPGAPNPTALVTVYDIVALRVMRRLQQLGLRVPQDVSVGNVNGQPLDGGDGLGLTTAVPPVQEIVDCALALLLKRPRDAHAVQHCLKPLFHEGQTTGPAPAHVPRLDRVPGGGPRLQSEQGAPGAG